MMWHTAAWAIFAAGYVGSVVFVAAGLHALWVLVATRTRLAALLQRRAPTYELAGRRSTPFATCLTVPLMVWLAAQLVVGGAR